MARLTALCSLAVLASCRPVVGTDCDDARARTLVYDATGAPAYEGQALLVTSCAGGGSFCHASTARERYGAPFGMNFDVVLADNSIYGSEANGAAHLFEAQRVSLHLRDDIFAEVVGGTMPPGEAGRAAMASPMMRYRDASDAVGVAMPEIGSADAREILRNWLACGAPLVEARNAPIPTGCTTNAACPNRRECDVGEAVCVDVGSTVPARPIVILPTWSSIYPGLIRPVCATSRCHGAAGAASSGQLDLSTPEVAWSSLVGATADDAACGMRVVPGSPDTSLLVAKLEATQDRVRCGVAMPITGLLAPSTVATLRAWITNGAHDD